MYQSLSCVALRTVRYDDSRSLLTAWSAEIGRVTFIIPAGASREARRRRALTMPLSLFAGQCDVRPGRDVLSIRDLRPLAVCPDISADPTKAIVAIFLAEVLDRLLRVGAPDPLLSSFIFDSVRRLDSLRRPAAVAAFPIVFLTRISQFFGIQPDCSDWRPGYCLDLADGLYRPTPPVHGRYLAPDAAHLAVTVSRLTYDSAGRLRLPRPLRREILSTILAYYTAHYTNLSTLSSLPVLQELF